MLGAPELRVGGSAAAPAKWPANTPDANLLQPAEQRNSAADLQSSAEQDAQAQAPQSKLAKLCQQTSSVLASVLPAPFGGHKRSILCQFFGHVQLATQRPPKHRPEQQAGPPSVAIIQQAHKAPVTMLATGRHPIELLIEQQQRQASEAAAGAQLRTRGATEQVARLQPKLHSAQVLQTEQLQQKQQQVAPTAGRQMKFSAPLVTVSLGASTPASVRVEAPANAWRIFNASLELGDPNGGQRNQSTRAKHPTTPYELAAGPLELAATKDELVQSASEQIVVARPEPRLQRPKTLLLGLQRPGQLEARPQQQVGPAASSVQGEESKLVRTIEVVAQQQASQPSSTGEQVAKKSPPLAASEQRQVQRREELVIASINNLTRIAFGNQLRDTVKAINRLIDQQAGIFGANSKQQVEPNGRAAALAQDPMQVSESRQVASRPFGAEEEEKSGGKLGAADSGQQQATLEKNSRVAQKRQQQKQNQQQQQLATTKSKKLAKIESAKRTSAEVPSGSSRTTPSRPRQSTGGATTRKLSPKLELRRLNSASDSPAPSNKQLGQRSTSGPTRSSWPPEIGRRESHLAGSSTPWIPARQPSSQRLGPNRRSSESTTARFGPNSAATTLGGHTESLWTHASDLEPSRVRPFKSHLQQAKWRPTSAKARTASETNELQTSKTQSKKEKRFEQTSSARDSLTTLKMSLLRSTLGSGAAETSTARPATTLGLQQTGATQSRWIATKVADQGELSAARETIATSPTLSTQSPPQTTSPGSALASTVSPTVSSSGQSASVASTSAPVQQVASSESSSAPTTLSEDLIDSQASESISKYTSQHLLSEQTSLLATSRRQQQQHWPTAAPQIAQTGDFFSADTIASWPERYQTMLERGQELERSSSSSSSARATTLSMALGAESTRRSGETYEATQTSSRPNHRSSETGARSSVWPSSVLKEAPGITILPANHKLDSAGATLARQESASARPTTPMGGAPAEATASETPSSEERATTLAAAAELGQLANEIQADLAAGQLGQPLRPPYHEDSPSAPATFVESADPLRRAPKQQRFSLSALRYLAHNLLGARALGAANSSELANLGDQQLVSAEQSARLLDLLADQSDGPSSPTNSSQYYELLASDGQPTMSPANRSSSRTWLERAGSLLGDLKQLEQRRAAALLAAIRYQVPGPLVRPWDLATDMAALQLQPPANDRRQDGNQSLARGAPALQLLSALLRPGLLLRQHLVGRDELEARLNGLQAAPDSRQLRRSDAAQLEPSEGAPNATRPLGLEHSLASNESAAIGEADFHAIELAPAQSGANQTASAQPKYMRLAVDSIERPAEGNSSPLSQNAIARSRHQTNRKQAKKQANDQSERRPDKSAEFQCADRAAGFYPDARSSCRVSGLS